MRYAVEKHGERDLPASVFVFDSPWARSYNDLIFNQDVFRVDAKLARRIKDIGSKPFLMGHVGIEPPRGQDWTVYDLMLFGSAGLPIHPRLEASIFG